MELRQREIDMEDTYPVQLSGTCPDCDTEMVLRHMDGVGGEGMGWPCPVCGDAVRMDGSEYRRISER
jgi:predicted RNA-binding Zn-ribbon protein involved in translation (DUF1610 family)